MDFPLYHSDFLGNRLIIAVIAILHVVISHGLAVGGMALVFFMEKKGLQDVRWDEVAKKTLFAFFLVTTSIGAMTGVGIWFSASLVNPTAIASLIRVFFWAWFVEWIVFVTEVVLILFYYLTWNAWKGSKKSSHVRLGANLALFSWITMAIIVGILAFMMDPGSWINNRDLLSGFLNPVYLPQLAFRTPLAMVMAGGAGLVVLFFLQIKEDFKAEVASFLAKWTLFWLPLLLGGSYLYLSVVPQTMKQNFGVALLTQDYANWLSSVQWTIVISVAFIFMLMLILLKTGARWRYLFLLPFPIYVVYMAQFERSREFIRKPYAIANYLYANGFRVEDYPLLQKEGILKFASYVSEREVTEENAHLVGRDVFMLACSRCHTVNGVNSVLGRIEKMYGTNEWSPDQLEGYLSVMHKSRQFMPPFPGNAAEKKALSSYLHSLKNHPVAEDGVQVHGILKK